MPIFSHFEQSVLHVPEAEATEAKARMEAKIEKSCIGMFDCMEKWFRGGQGQPQDFVDPWTQPLKVADEENVS